MVKIKGLFCGEKIEINLINHLQCYELQNLILNWTSIESREGCTGCKYQDSEFGCNLGVIKNNKIIL